MDHAPVRTPEREAFYNELAPQEHGAAVGSAARARHARAGDALRAGAVALRRGAAVPDGVGHPDHRQGSGAARADPRESRAAGQRLHHAHALCRAAAHPARRGGAGHRHTQSALRFIVEGEGAYTAVDGERTIMQPGRLRHHAVLDLARSRQRQRQADGVARRARHPDGGDVRRGLRRERQCRAADGDARPRATSLARYGSGLLPVDWKPETQDLADLQLSLCAHARGAGDAAPRRGAPDACHGYKLRYVNPATRRRADADHGAPSCSCCPRASPARPIAGPTARSSSCVEGEGETRDRRQDLRLEAARHLRRAELGAAQRTRPTSEAVLFCFSDRPVQEKLDLWREERSGH